jgi:CRISPR-associated protein Csb2
VGIVEPAGFRVVARPHFAVYLLRGRHLPHAISTLLVAEGVRRGFNGAYGQRYGGRTSANFTGKREGEIRRDQHQHCFFLPVAEADRLTQLYVWAPGGFTDEEVHVLKTMRSVPDTRFAKTGLRFHLTPLALLENGEREAYFGCSSLWISSTPYLCPRHPKRTGKDTPEGQIRRECEARGYPEPRSVEEVESLQWRRYTLQRPGKDPPRGEPRGYRLEFAEPVIGPLSLGASSHFGMGRFQPA